MGLLATIFGIMIVATPVTVYIMNKKASEQAETVARKTLSSGMDKLTPEEKKLKVLLQSISLGQVKFYRKNFFTEGKVPNEYYIDDKDFKLTVSIFQNELKGKITLSEKEKEVLTFTQNISNKRNQKINPILYSRFFNENKMLFETAIHTLIDYDWENYEVEQLKMENEYDGMGELDIYIESIKSKFILLSTHEEELDIETKHTINTLMNKDMPRLIDSFVELKEEEKEKQKKSIIAMLEGIDRKLESYLSRFSDNKVQDLEVAKKIIEKRLGIDD